MNPALADRVQRIVSGEIPILHLEPDVPSGDWPMVVDGLVAEPRVVADVRSLARIERWIDLHCVWGWSRPDHHWEGVHLNALGRPLPEATHVLVSARESPYAACFTIEEARDGIFAWRVDGRDLSPERGWPLRFVAPSYKWAYKHVKWVERVTFVDRFTPGMWEARVGNPKGDVPWDVLQRFQGAVQRLRAQPTPI